MKTGISRLKEINSALPGLLFGIMLFGVICQIAGLFLVSDRADFSRGLWIGVLTAIFMSFHMAISLNSIVERNVKEAQAAATRQNIIRYLVVVIVLGILMVTRIGNPLAAFAGVMGLKLSAYAQPIFAKLSHNRDVSDEHVSDEVQNGKLNKEI